ncbi:hypothetical protein TrVGV298_011981 [Trichoderma virens]|nr:hypothetical protein TrVGV298_011981 [Trichoderma virens]
MVAERKQKSCISCIRAKRKCDKVRPFCRRCEDKGLDCRYSPTVRRTTAKPSPSAESTEIPGHVFLINTHVSSLSAPASSKLWFMAPETWNIDKSSSRAPPIPIPVFRTFIHHIQHWLIQWIRDGGCPFIHRQLYADGFFPSCMQDAFSAISIQQSCNSRNQDLTARIIQDRANFLIKSGGIEEDNGNLMSMNVPVLNTSQHLARVQALLIYQILRLFEKGIWQQTRAEEAMLTLLSWCQQMWDSATLDCITTSQPTSNYTVSDDSQQNDPSNANSTPRLWRLWILSESIRRTWLAVMATISAYRTMKDGWCECAGGITFTARRSLWRASTSSQWAIICRTEDPLFLPCLGDRATLESCNPNDVDEFASSYFSLIWGPEWVEGHGARPLADT